MRLIASRVAAALLACGLALTAAAAHAGRNCDAAQPPSAINVQRAFDLAARTATALDATGAQVVVLARNGQDLRKYGLRWSHLGFAYRDANTPGNPWRVVHKLNACGTARGDVYRQGLGEFFLDDLFRYEAAVVVPTADAQTKLAALLVDDNAVARLHQADYSMLAYPWAQRYQQSNQWAIETLAFALEPGAGTRERAQAWLQFKGYEPTTLNIPALARLGARIGTANIAFDDHPNDKRYSDRIETVTVDSVFTWLERSGLGGPAKVLR
jgi:hypothetical protein